MVEQGYNYLDGSIHSMADFFETRINQSHQVFPDETEKNPRKGPRKGKERLLMIPRMGTQRRNIRVKSFASTMARADIPRTSGLL